MPQYQGGAAVVVKAQAGIFLHRQVESELDPVVRLGHHCKGVCRINVGHIFVPLQPVAHGQ